MARTGQYRAQQQIQLEVVGWTDRGNGFQRADTTAGVDPALWAMGDRLRQAEFRRPPDGIRDTRGTPLWSLLSVELPRGPRWCLAVQFRAPGHAAGTLQLAFAPSDLSAGDVWAAASLLVGEDELLPWTPERIGVEDAREQFAELTGAALGSAGELADRIEHTLIRLTAEQPRILVSGSPAEVRLILGKVLALVPDAVAADYLWTTCLTYLPESAKTRVVSGQWPPVLADREPGTAHRIAAVLADRGEPPAQSYPPKYERLIRRLAERAAQGAWQVDEQRRSVDYMSDLLEVEEQEEEPELPAPEPEQRTERVNFLRAASPWGRAGRATDARGSARVPDGPPPSAAIREQLRADARSVSLRDADAWSGRDPRGAAEWLFVDTVAERASSTNSVERVIFKNLVRIVDASEAHAALLPVPDGTTVQLDDPRVTRLAGLLNVHSNSQECELLFVGAGRRYYPGRAADYSGRYEFLRGYLRVPTERDPTADDTTVREVVSGVRRRDNRRLVDVVDVERLATVASLVRAAGSMLEKPLATGAAALLLEFLADCFDQYAPHLSGTGVAASAQRECVQLWIRPAGDFRSEWLLQLMPKLERNKNSSVDQGAVFNAGLALLSPQQTLQDELRALNGLIARYPDAGSAPMAAALDDRYRSYLTPPPSDGSTGERSPQPGWQARFNAVPRSVRYGGIGALAFALAAGGIIFSGVSSTLAPGADPPPPVATEQTDNADNSQSVSGPQFRKQVGRVVASGQIDGSYPGLISVTGVAYDVEQGTYVVPYRVHLTKEFGDSQDLGGTVLQANLSQPVQDGVAGKHGFAAAFRVPGGGRFIVNVEVRRRDGSWSSVSDDVPISAETASRSFPDAADLKVESGPDGATVLRGYAAKPMGKSPPRVVAVLGTPPKEGGQFPEHGKGVFSTPTANQPPFRVTIPTSHPRGRYMAWLYLVDDNDIWYFWVATPVDLK